jgi:hypothetical protein
VETNGLLTREIPRALREVGVFAPPTRDHPLRIRPAPPSTGPREETRDTPLTSPNAPVSRVRVRALGSGNSFPFARLGVPRLHDAAAEGASSHLGKSGWVDKVVGHHRPLSGSLRHSLLEALNTTPKLTTGAVIEPPRVI